LGATSDLREQEHFAVWPDRLEERVLIDLAVDRDGHALFQMRRDLRVQFGELLEELFDGRRRELKLGDARGEPPEGTDQEHSRHFTWGPRNGPHTPTRSSRPGEPVALLYLASRITPSPPPLAL